MTQPDNTIDTQAPEPADEPADSMAPEAGDAEPAADDSSPSGREKRYRLELRAEQAGRAADRQQSDAEKAELRQSAADASDKLRTTQHQLVDHHIGARMHDVADFWARHDLADMLDEDSDVDLGKVDDLVNAMPAHLRTPAYGTPPAPEGGATEKIGFGSTSVLDFSTGAETPHTSWTDVLKGGANPV